MRGIRFDEAVAHFDHERAVVPHFHLQLRMRAHVATDNAGPVAAEHRFAHGFRVNFVERPPLDFMARPADDAAISVEGDEKRVYYPSYAMVQEAIKGSAVSEGDLRNVPEIHKVISEVVSVSWEWYKENQVAVDLVGMDTLKDILNMPIDQKRFLRLHNFRKDKVINPVLIDARLLEPRRVAPPSRPITDSLIQFQHFGLQNLLNNSSGSSDKMHLEGGNPRIRELADRCFAFTRRFQAASKI